MDFCFLPDQEYNIPKEIGEYLLKCHKGKFDAIPTNENNIQNMRIKSKTDLKIRWKFQQKPPSVVTPVVNTVPAPAPVTTKLVVPVAQVKIENADKIEKPEIPALNFKLNVAKQEKKLVQKSRKDS